MSDVDFTTPVTIQDTESWTIEFRGTHEDALVWLANNPSDVCRNVVLSDLQNKIGFMHEPDFVTMHGELKVIRDDYPDYVGRFYSHDPKTVDFVSDGFHLRNGMRVLIFGTHLREDISNLSEEPLHIYHKAQDTNRWCTVTDLRLAGLAGDPTKVVFTGVYDDGSKIDREYSVKFMWYVTKDSLVPAKELDTKRERVLELVSEAMDEVSNGMTDTREQNALSEKITDKIMKLWESK